MNARGQYQILTHLKARTEEQRNLSNVTDIAFRIQSFRRFLSAMYTRPYTLEHIRDLKQICSLARHLTALPMLSATIVNGLVNSRMFEEVDQDGQNLFAAQPPIYSLSPTRSGVPYSFANVLYMLLDDGKVELQRKKRIQETDPKLWKVAIDAYDDDCNRMMEASQDLVIALAAGYFTHGSIKVCGLMSGPGRYGTENPQLLRTVREALSTDKTSLYPNVTEQIHRLKKAIPQLLSFNLFIDWTGSRAGYGPYRHCLLCYRISDEDMPWDANEVEW
jgi:hypothetical protein